VSFGEEEKWSSSEEVVSYAHITEDFGEGFLFSSETVQVDAEEVEELMSGTRHNVEEWDCDIWLSLFSSTKYRKIVQLSCIMPTFDEGDREFDSWHDLYLLQEQDGTLRAVYCTGGYSIAKIQGFAKVYQYPESLKKYFD